MSIAAATVYTGSVNPSRRAKASRTLLPRQTSVPAEPAASVAASEKTDVNAPALPARRGRKPGSSSSSSGGLSRTARETQRKLNHSIIEKARRTKINEALAELARLGEEAGDRGPSDTTDPTRSDEQEDDQVDDDDDDVHDGDYGVPSAPSSRTRAKPISRPTSDSTNSSKGKDKFKLDILVRTVESMQFLLEKVKKLEAELRDVKTAGCHRCSDRELADQVKESEVEVTVRENKRKRHAELEVDERAQRKRQFALPSISSWLPNSHSPDISTSLSGGSPFGLLSMLSPRTAPFDTQSRLASYLPSPPSSTQFTPSAIASSGAMPVLELGPSSVPVAANRAAIYVPSVPPCADSASLVQASRRPESGSSISSTSSKNADGLKPLTTPTPEDESAASLLLHISSSPPVFTTARGRKGSMLERVEPMAMPMPTLMPLTSPAASTEDSACNSLISRNPNPSNWKEGMGELLSSAMIVDSTNSSSGVVIAQTPSSILGLG